MRYQARLGPDGRIESLTEISAGARGRVVAPFSAEGIAILRSGQGVEYRFDEERRLRELPYLAVLDALRQEALLMAHKVRHGELLDEPEALPVLKALLAGISDAAAVFRRMCENGAVEE